MVYCEFSLDNVAFFAEGGDPDRRLAGELLVRLLVARIVADGANPDGVVVHYVDDADSPKFTEFNEGRASMADAAEMIATLIASGHSRGHLAVDGRRYRIHLDAGDGLVTFW